VSRGTIVPAAIVAAAIARASPARECDDLAAGGTGDPETTRVIECNLIKIKDNNRSATEEKHRLAASARLGTTPVTTM
jgi:hypothetical protein